VNWKILLDISAACLLAGLFAAGLYELLALINLHVPFTPNFPLITWIVRPWIAAHPQLALLIATLVFGSFFWLFFHFYLGTGPEGNFHQAMRYYNSKEVW
jgi:hypothetical protein